jgi:hypothetical protein
VANTTRADSRGSRAGARRPGREELPPLAEAKLAAPRQRAATVRRARILRTLDDSAGAALTLVAAPAGSGKSTAVRDWCASRQTAFAWVTLDAGDNDPARFWTYVATAVDRLRDSNRRFVLLIGVATVATLIVTELGFLQRIFDTVPLTSSQWGVCLLGPIIYVAIVELMKLVDRRLEHRHQVPAPATA